MKKPKLPNQKKAYKDLGKRLNTYTRKIISIYETLAKESAKIATSTDFDGDGEFSFDDYPRTEKKVNALMDYYSNNMQALVYNGISDEWKNSNTLQDLLAKRVIGTFTRKIADAKQKAYFEHNNAAKKAFIERKIKGLGLSERIWNQRADVKEALEKSLSVGIEKGMSAVKLSKKVSKYLNDYPSLAKDYKKKYGKAITIQNCEYRSVRLARNEINMAYRSAEQERWARMDYIKGKEIKPSGSHPKHDMCDELAGIYPLPFDWNGWHVNCMCYAIPIVMSEEEYWSVGPKRRVSEVPKQFNDYIRRNESKILSSKSIPVFLTNNEQYITSSIVLKSERGKQFLSLKDDKEYTDVAMNSKGGLKATHVKHEKADENQEPCLGKMTGYDLEYELRDLAYNNGHSVILCKEGERMPNTTSQYKSLDMIFDGVRMDIKSVCSYTYKYRNQIKTKNKQLSIWNAQQNDNSNTVCLYFHDKKMFKDESVVESYKSFVNVAKQNKQPIVVKNIVCVIKDGEKLVIKRYSF